MTKINDDIYGAGSRKFILVGVNSSDEVTAYTVDETISKEAWKAGISSSGIVDYDVNIGTYYRLASGTNLDVDDVKSQYEKYRDEEFRSFTWLENEFDTWKTGSGDQAIGYSYGPSAPKNFNVLYINKSSNKTSYEISSGVDDVMLDFKLEELFTLMSDDLKGWHVFTPDDPTDPSSVIENYNPDYSGTAEYAGTKEGLKQAYNDWNNNSTDNMFIGGMFESSTTYTVQYNQNLPTGYTLSGGMTWYTDSTTTDLTGSPIVLKGSDDMTCEDTSGNTRTLQGWNTYSSGAGSSYSFGASINTDAGFIGDTLTLYAMWSDPVAPTTGFMYWKVDGDDNNKTIHYYASPGEGRAAVVIGTNGVEHTGLGSSDREKIKYAVFEDNIAATNLECCFENFRGLVSITDLGKLDTSNVTSMRQMFNFAGVKELDLTNFETSNVTDMYGMFSSCENLETIKVSDKFVVDQVPNNYGKYMFSGCEKLVGEKGTKIADLSSPFGVAYAHIDEGSTNPGLFSGASTPPTTYTVKYNQDLPTGYILSGGMTWYTDSTTTDLTGSPITLKGSADMTCEDTSGNTRTLQAWNTQIELKGNTFNFGDTFNDSQYFDPDPTCTLYAVWSDPVPPAPTPVTTDWYWYLDGTHMHYTATDGAGRTKVTFNGDLGVDYGSTDVLTVTEVTIDDKIAPENLHGLFRRFNSLTKINKLTNLDTSNCTDMARMFQSCSSLESINVSHFNTSKVKDMSRVFQNCEKLKSVDVSNFDTQNAETMHQMFGTCLVITDIKFSSKFVTNKVTKMYEMFSRCEKIASLDISSFDISSVTNANDMFASCHELVTIKTSPTLDFSSVGSGNDMFKYCFKIKGGKGTTYDENHVDKSYAHVDGGTSNPGYFTSSGGPTPPGPTPPGPTPPSPGGGGTGGGSSSGGSEIPPKGYTSEKQQGRKVINDALIDLLKSYKENQNSPVVNARDSFGNVGHGQWLHIPNTSTWYFLTGDFNTNIINVNANVNVNTNLNQNQGFLVDGWYNLGWDGEDKWYRFDVLGVMQLG